MVKETAPINTSVGELTAEEVGRFEKIKKEVNAIQAVIATCLRAQMVIMQDLQIKENKAWRDIVEAHNLDPEGVYTTNLEDSRIIYKGPKQNPGGPFN